MATIREMLDSPEDHPGLFRAVFGVPMQIKVKKDTPKKTKKEIVAKGK